MLVFFLFCFKLHYGPWVYDVSVFFIVLCYTPFFLVIWLVPVGLSLLHVLMALSVASSRGGSVYVGENSR
jgi:hypothetical protein